MSTLTQFRYKAGDKVVIDGKSTIHNFRKGEKVTVIEVTNGDEHLPYKCRGFRKAKRGHGRGLEPFIQYIGDHHIKNEPI